MAGVREHCSRRERQGLSRGRFPAGLSRPPDEGRIAADGSSVPLVTDDKAVLKVVPDVALSMEHFLTQ